MKRSNLFLLTLAATLFSSGCGDSSTPDANGNMSPVAVRVVPTGAGQEPAFLTISGKVEAGQSARVSTRMMGYITRIHARVGETVNEGQLLVSLQNEGLQAKTAQARAGVAEAKAAYENARKDFERFQNLYASESASQKELDDMAARFEMAAARLNAAREMENEVEAEGSYVRIRAPFSGVITQKYAEEGDLASPGMPLLGLENPGRFKVSALVPENEVSRVREGDTARVLIKSLGLQVPGTVSELSSSAMATGGQYRVTISLPKPVEGLRSGMYASVRFPGQPKAGPARGSLLIPREAIVTQGQLTGVYTVSQSQTALLRWLRLGREYGEQVEVLSGLRPGETLIISAEGKLYNGAPLRIQ
ncbi:efflux RND transporter periplasmic adaptor subunit [Robiginitalea marina]|uniref:Efflux RND transporter periplasmic adaptor subunit n=1 Tax=Robiginitalea marina TaxID=2954105 RepID=A0ABT1B1V7_9FLAO|nr:efflux RND transporter periplasmic adaptor subunit [Robiginitalea marina]MCO5725398.1 efflux RND transporter periplasmic adaptor subunit [Robiginitalea marina]